MCVSVYNHSHSHSHTYNHSHGQSHIRGHSDSHIYSHSHPHIMVLVLMWCFAEKPENVIPRSREALWSCRVSVSVGPVLMDVFFSTGVWIVYLHCVHKWWTGVNSMDVLSMLYVCACVWNVSCEICVNSMCHNSMDVNFQWMLISMDVNFQWMFGLYPFIVWYKWWTGVNSMDVIVNGCFFQCCMCVCVFGVYHMKYVSIQCVIIQWMLIFNGC